MNNDQVFIGIDMGATKILAAVLDSRGTVIGREKVPTEGRQGAQQVLDNINKATEKALESTGIKRSKLAAIGITVPGTVDPAQGNVIRGTNMDFNDYPLGKELSERYGVPAIVENDVNAGTFGEFRFGSGTGVQDLIGVFPGTGIGGGIILDGRLYRGKRGMAGEVGHMIIQTDGPICGCGQRGCVEALAGRTSMARDAAFLTAVGKSPGGMETGGTDILNYKSKALYKAYKSGDPAIRGVIERGAYYLGIGLANLVNILNPELIIIGGGIIDRFGSGYLDILDESMREHAMSEIAAEVRLAEAALGDDSVFMGLFGLFLEEPDGR
ncbi:MAG: ROK family protein [Spirochaetales bacterium]|nr:ROK family protein [Spirochaetales bacterium]MCF7938274.1 ROK family protein [Spirochaetales bacterium]